MKQPTLFDLPPADNRPPDQAVRDFAIDPANDVVLEASAGTGKTRVLVDRYVRLIEAGVDPRNILAITFTRKAAAEMRDRVLIELERRAAVGQLAPDRWRRLRERLSEIQISTIDAFCFGLLREFPLEADVDPAFEIADETEMARFANEAVELTMRAIRGDLVDDETLRLLLARVKWPVLRDALAGFLDRRQVALPAVQRFVGRLRRPATSSEACAKFLERVRAAIVGSLFRRALLDDGPHGAAEFDWLHRDLVSLDTFPATEPARVQQLRRRLERYFFTQKGDPRQRLGKPFTERFTSPDVKKRHEAAMQSVAGDIRAALDALDDDVNGLLARGLLRLLAVASDKYERLLAHHALLDFAGMLDRAVALLSRQEEFARSRLKLQSRYHHLLVDEFQDTSRLQWRLIELLVDAWGEGEGVADAPTSIFVVGDRKQSIYRFRHAEVTLLDEAARKISALRPRRQVRQAITASFRAVPELLAFVNALATEMQSPGDTEERFMYGDTDRFSVPPVGPGARRDGRPVLGVVAQPSMAACAAAVATEIADLLASAVVRDRATGVRPARPEDIAILFRARTGHQLFEQVLESRGIRPYVYKGLGFFDAPEVQDLQALLRYLAEPDSDLRAAEFLRSRFVRLSDRALAALAPAGPRYSDPSPSFSAALRSDDHPVVLEGIDRELLEAARADVKRWTTLQSRLTPSELVDTVLRESAYLFELRGWRRDQARENVKKLRALIRRVENRGYATIGRIAAYLETLRAGEESNAIVEAAGAVHLMTIHSAKGLEFPIVFVVNVHVGGRGRAAGFSIVERNLEGEPEVAFRTTDATRLEDERETEELRRLCYVAVTRARDRLYLAGEIDPKGRLRKGHRSLAQLFPADLQETFAAAASTTADEVEWPAAGGTFAFKVCRPSATMASDPVATESRPAAAAQPLLPPRLVADSTVRTVASAVELQGGSSGLFTVAGLGEAPRSERLLGTVVHRLFQRQPALTATSGDLVAVARQLVRADEHVDVDDLDACLGAAVSAFDRLRRRPDLAEWLGRGECFYEVPFSYAPAEGLATVIRGVIDCIVLDRAGQPTVLEFKTGSPRPEHQAQVELYRRAAQEIFKVPSVEVKILYP